MARRYEEVQASKRYLVEMIDADTIAKTKMFDLSLAELDRTELLGVVCFLLKYPYTFGLVDAQS